MTEQQAEKSSESYCDVCGIRVKQDTETELKRFGKFFCSNEHMEMYIKAKQRELGLGEQQQKHHERGRERRRWFGGACC